MGIYVAGLLMGGILVAWGFGLYFHFPGEAWPILGFVSVLVIVTNMIAWTEEE